MPGSLRILFIAFAVVLPSLLKAQIDDIGLWVGGTLKKQITRELEGSFTEELRLHHDLTEIDVFYSDIALEYSFSKKLKASFHYRFINSNQDNYYSKRHRFYIDVSWKEKLGIFSFTLRERVQQQYNDYNSSEDGKIPVYNIRSKITAKADVNKKYFPYFSTEMYYLLDNAKEVDNITSRFRYEIGFEYEFNRTHSMNPFILLQDIQSPPFQMLIYGISYSVYL